MAGTVGLPERMMSGDITVAEVAAAATAFLTAFDQLDWEPFSRFIAPEATVFMPFCPGAAPVGWESGD